MWQEGYRELFIRLSVALEGVETPGLTFELIQHRFTGPAKKVIEKNYPKSKLQLDESKRKYKWGRYGIGKYVYKTEEAAELETVIRGYVKEYFPDAVVQYFT